MEKALLGDKMTHWWKGRVKEQEGKEGKGGEDKNSLMKGKEKGGKGPYLKKSESNIQIVGLTHHEPLEQGTSSRADAEPRWSNKNYNNKFTSQTSCHTPNEGNGLRDSLSHIRSKANLGKWQW